MRIIARIAERLDFRYDWNRTLYWVDRRYVMVETGQGVINMWGSHGIENELNKVVQEFNELRRELRRISAELVARMKDRRFVSVAIAR